DQIISQEGFEKLKEELEFLTKTKRREIAARIEKAKDLGDLSENAEYHDAKDAQAFNEGRIIELEHILKNVTIVSNGSAKNEIGMGSKITVETNGKEKVYTIVSFNEADPLEGKISNESPLGTAFLNKKKGETITVNTPRGEVKYKIIHIE
ncbi:MAG: transcription elongation factor GreA, partial [Patescibacteria group bacterium]